jgi:hypothetical protein
MPGCPLSPRRLLIFPCQAAEIAVEPIGDILGPDGGPTEASLAAGFSAAAVGSVDGLYFNQDRVAIIGGQMADPRSLALLKTLGLIRSQVLRVVAWEASALTAVALLAGLPLGVLADRWAWALFAGSAGVSALVDVPVPLVLLAIPVTLALANLIAAEPGWDAARVRPASLLRSE